MKKRLSKQTGAGSMLVLLFLMTTLGISLAVLSLTTTQDLVNRRNVDKAQATSLAESGVHTLYEKIRSQMLASQTFPFSTGVVAVTATTPNGVRKLGTYDAKVVDNKEIVTDIDVYSGKIRRSTYTFTLESVGMGRSGVLSKVRSKFTATLEKQLAPKSTVAGTPPDITQLSFPIGALSSNSTITVESNDGLETTAPNGLSGHMTANGGISWTSASGSKTSVTRPDFLKLQGQYLVPPGGPYVSTLSPTGIGNSNGTVNYENPAAPASGSFSGSPANAVLQLMAPMNFANSGQTATWKGRWLSDATRTGFTDYPATVDTDMLTTTTPGGAKVIQAPARISGDLKVLGSATLKLMPNSTNPRENVIYVTGDVKNLGSLQNLGCTLVVEGKYEDGPTADYHVTTNESPFTTRERVMNRSMLAVLGSGSDVVKLKMNGAHETGLVYALNGGFEITGHAPELTGSLIAGGPNPSGGILIKPASGSKFTMHYEPYATTGGPLLLDSGSYIDKDYVVVGIYSDFYPQRLRDWANLKP